MPGDLLFVARADQLDDAELISDRLPVVVGEYQPDPVTLLELLGRGPDAPAAVHAEMGVDGEAAAGPGQQVLATGGGLGHHVTGQVGGGQPWDTEVTAGQRPSRQRLVQGSP